MAPKEPGLAAIETISSTFKQAYDKREDEEWRGHSLEWITNKPSASVGKIGRLIAQGLFESSNLVVKPEGYFLDVANRKILCRFSTGWSGGGFKFEQLRNESYAAVFCLGITPQRAYVWTIPKSLIFDAKGSLLKKEGLTHQHKGKDGSDTAWLNVDVQQIPRWLDLYGGSLSQAMDSLKALLR